MTRYELFKFLHLVGAIVWLGGGLGILLLWRRFAGAKDLGSLKAVDAQNKFLSMALFGPATLLTLAFGIAMVIDTPVFDFTDLWIVIGFGGILLSGVAEGAFAQPAGKAFMSAVESGGFESAAARRAGRKLAIVGNVELIILFAVVWAMVVKPTL